jgi:RNA polymerase sigma factor (sigma-70 family)
VHFVNAKHHMRQQSIALSQNLHYHTSKTLSGGARTMNINLQSTHPYRNEIHLTAHILTVAPECIASHINDYNVLRQTLEHVISTLRPQEQEVINLRYGLHDSQWRTYKAVGLEIGISQQRAHQVLKTAFKKLRHPVKSGILMKCLE